MHLFISSQWVVAVTLLVAAHLAVAQPIRPSNWVKTDQYKDPESRGIWRVFEKFEKPDKGLSELSQGKPSQPHLINDRGDELIQHGSSGWLYKRRKTFNKSIISILILDLAASARPVTSHHKGAEYPGLHPALGTSASLDRHAYEETSAYAQAVPKHSHDLEADAATPILTASDHYLPPNRIPYPFMNLKPASFSQISFPGAFTMFMIVLALVWIATLTIGLMEFGNYLWKRRRATRLAAATEVHIAQLRSEQFEGLDKIPMQSDIIPQATELVNEDPSSSFELDAEAASGLDDYRIV